MKAWNSTFKASRTPLVRGEFKRKKPVSNKEQSLAMRIAMQCGTLAQHKRKPSKLLRSEEHRRNVAALGCLLTGAEAQACHVNFGKGMGIKACDSLCFPLAPHLHAQHDQGGMPKKERWRVEWEYVDKTRAQLIRKNLWSAELEAHYRVAVEPLSRVVHEEEA
ncbi:hypothetical protein [Alcaligenes endophyticus]|uniref:Uncharacterized protein n=1 Tax=Alcaligenes endophyticus TaxID=1929088 RepID=A0ABT8EIY8_9BURK|nr:hypothetical protein [Alcaligenes endophyticus]MCX5592510.1 hypothetical protein [Alcaligenes endophyticus]MDN4121236.1 hypothetical protein [Alcaligenes endophyticus]